MNVIEIVINGKKCVLGGHEDAQVLATTFTLSDEELSTVDLHLGGIIAPGVHVTWLQEQLGLNDEVTLKLKESDYANAPIDFLGEEDEEDSFWDFDGEIEQVVNDEYEAIKIKAEFYKVESYEEGSEDEEDQYRPLTIEINGSRYATTFNVGICTGVALQEPGMLIVPDISLSSCVEALPFIVKHLGNICIPIKSQE